MNNDNLNLLVYLSGVAGLSASIGSAGANIFNYYLISRGLRRISSVDKDAAKNIDVHDASGALLRAKIKVRNALTS